MKKDYRMGAGIMIASVILLFLILGIFLYDYFHKHHSDTRTNQPQTGALHQAVPLIDESGVRTSIAMLSTGGVDSGGDYHRYAALFDDTPSCFGTACTNSCDVM